MKALSRTHCQVDDTTYKLYPVGAPLWYKKSDGTFDDIDLTFNDTTSSIGDISLMDKGIMSVGKRKGNNPHKVVGVRPDKNQHLGTQQLEFSLINVELDGVSQDFNVETDLEILLTRRKTRQLVKLNKSFKDCKIEFDIYAKGLTLENNKYEESTVIRDFGFNITNIGDNNGNTTLGMHNAYNRLNKDISYFDCFAGKITDEFIAKGVYTDEEEFEDSNLSDYSFLDMFKAGSSIYFKDAIIFTAQAYNLNNIENIMANNICDIYGLEIFDDGGSGKYFKKDNKKVGGYGATDEVFFAFINTADIPDKIKTLFKRKNFEDTSFLDLELSDFCTAMSSKFNKDLKIEVDNTYYKPGIKNDFSFKISDHSFNIGLPVAFDKDYNTLDYYTTHTLKQNDNGSYRYTKILKPETALDFNSAQYLDAALYVSTEEFRCFAYINDLSTPFDPRTSTHFDNIRENQFGDGSTGYPYYGDHNDQSRYSNDDGARPGCGEGNYFAAATQFLGAQGQYSQAQTHMQFDSSGVTGTVTDLAFKCKGEARIAYPDGETAPHSDISIIFLKSVYTPAGSAQQQWNKFVPSYSWSTSWSGSDFLVKEYSGELVVTDVHTSHATSSTVGADRISLSSSALVNIGVRPRAQSFDFNADAKSDLETLSDFKICMMEYDAYYLDSYDNLSSFSQRPASAVTSENLERAFYFGESDSTNSSMVPYLEYTVSGGGTPTATDNATFFGANF